MRVLLTTDLAGGVWTYTEELATGLVGRGHEVHLVSFGGQPAEQHRAWLKGHPEIGFTALDSPLEWMPEPEPGLTRSGEVLHRLVDELRPEVVHLNQFYPGALELGPPKVVVAHSDVVSWWRSVRAEEPPDDKWFRRYRGWVSAGLAGADIRVAPSEWAAGETSSTYGCGTVRVIHNGRSARGGRRAATDRERLVVTIGRLWDEGKGALDLLQAAPVIGRHARVAAAGPIRHPAGGPDFPVNRPGLEWRGVLTEPQLVELLGSAAAYVGTSRYEPFGLAPLEAALAGCALVLTDIPTFRELWDGAAHFYPPGDVRALADRVIRLMGAEGERRELAAAARARALERYSADAMTRACEALYAELAGTHPS